MVDELFRAFQGCQQLYKTGNVPLLHVCKLSVTRWNKSVGVELRHETDCIRTAGEHLSLQFLRCVLQLLHRLGGRLWLAVQWRESVHEKKNGIHDFTCLETITLILLHLHLQNVDLSSQGLYFHSCESSGFLVMINRDYHYLQVGQVFPLIQVQSVRAIWPVAVVFAVRSSAAVWSRQKRREATQQSLFQFSCLSVQKEDLCSSSLSHKAAEMHCGGWSSRIICSAALILIIIF